MELSGLENRIYKDAFHIACASHRARLKNNLSAIGIDPIEKSLLEQRRLNLTAAQDSYAEKQKAALAAPKRKIIKK